MSGSQQIQALQDAGFSEDIIQDHVQERSDALLQGGFSTEDVNNYFGYKEPNTKKIEQYWKAMVLCLVLNLKYTPCMISYLFLVSSHSTDKPIFYLSQIFMSWVKTKMENIF